MVIRRWSEFTNEGLDIWSALNNFIGHGVRSLGRSFKREKQGMLAEIERVVDENWYEYDVEFLDRGIIITNPETSRHITIDLFECGIIMGGQVVYFPKSDLRELYDKIYKIRQDKMTVPGTYLASSMSRPHHGES